MAKKRAVIIGVGNLILKDEGVGVHAVRELEGKELPPGVEVIDGGTATMDLLSVIQEAERIIVIDALKAGGEPGTIYRVIPDDLISESERPLSLHQVGLLEVLGTARQLGGHGEVVIIGVEPKEVSWGMELTPEVEVKVPKVIEAVFEELKGLW
ncbi:MAG: HyaD/HybD family hydrogenase maturation endopeptidase [Deltaproteobacteria bacterium]|nr:HyaD/HybD family hydrogenase maturation endopeptidase [Deltaproteobacteria bacterium]